MKKILLALGFLGQGIISQAQLQSNYVGFEQGNGHNPVESGSVDNTFFNNQYHIQFYNLQNDNHPLLGTTTFDPNDPYNTSLSNYINTIDLPVYAAVGGHTNAANGRVAFGNSIVSNSTLDDCLPNQTSGDYPWDAPSFVDVGCWFLTDNDGTVSPNPKPLVIEYDIEYLNCTEASGYMYDLDFSSQSSAEAWLIEAYTYNTGTGIVALEQSLVLASPTYTSYSCTGCPSPFSHSNTVISTTTGDGSATYWEFTGLTNPLRYVVMTHMGSTTRSVGVAFDYFYFCSTHDVDECNLIPEETHETFGCGVQFTDMSTYTGTYPIVGYLWSFGDGTTSTEQNPFHNYGGAGNFVGTLTVTGYNGEECCTETIEFEVGTEECEDCQGETGFTWTSGECDPCLITVSPFVSYNTTSVLGYYWEVMDNTTGVVTVYTGSNPQIYLNGYSTITLTAIFQSLIDSDECCIATSQVELDCESSGSTGELSIEGKRAQSDDANNLSQDEEDFLDLSDSFLKGTYPNPVNSQLFLEFEMVSQENLTIQLISTNGQVHDLSTNFYVDKGVNETSFDISKYPNGLYFLRVQGESVISTKTITIKH